ncbi:MAG: hypothetical protein ACI83B_002663, partial [Sediminicola sp.]
SDRHLYNWLASSPCLRQNSGQDKPEDSQYSTTDAFSIDESILRPLEVTRAFFINSSTILSPVLGYKLVQLFKRLGTIRRFFPKKTDLRKSHTKE